MSSKYTPDQIKAKAVKKSIEKPEYKSKGKGYFIYLDEYIDKYQVVVEVSKRFWLTVDVPTFENKGEC